MDKDCTVTVKMKKLDLKIDGKNYFIIDVPGMPKFAKKMIRGIQLADYAILVIDIDTFENVKMTIYE